MTMRKALALALSALLAIVFFAAAPARSAERGTPEEARALLTQAMEFYKANGEAAAFAEINNPKGKFKKKDLYIFVQGFDGKTVAHGGNASLVGKNMLQMADVDGKKFIVEFIELAKAQGSGTVDYKWTNPETKKMEPKASFIMRIPGRELLMGCGYYK